jgi:hypothetical protein
MVSPVLLKTSRGSKFFWNIDANVGAASPNKTEDVQLVQLGYSILSTAVNQSASLKAISAKVQVGATCTGRDDDPLVKAIRAHQAERGGTQDGHVSTIKTQNGVYFDSSGGHTFMLTALINIIFDAQPADFPRIDKLPACPPALKAVVVASCSR